MATDRLIVFSIFSDSTNPLGKVLLRNIETALAVASSIGTDPLDPSQILTACLINRLPVASGKKSDEITLTFQPISRGKIIDFWELVYEFVQDGRTLSDYNIQKDSRRSQAQKRDVQPKESNCIEVCHVLSQKCVIFFMFWLALGRE